MSVSLSESFDVQLCLRAGHCLHSVYRGGRAVSHAGEMLRGLFLGFWIGYRQGAWRGSLQMIKKTLALGLVSRRGTFHPNPGIPVSAPPTWNHLYCHIF